MVSRWDRCPGTVVVHRDEAVTCSERLCHSSMTKADFFERHEHVVHCTDARGGSGCPLCGFRHRVRPSPDATVQEVGAAPGRPGPSGEESVMEPARFVAIRVRDTDGVFTVIGWVDGQPVTARCSDHEVRCTRSLWERACPHFAPDRHRRGDDRTLVVVDSTPARALTALFGVFVRACDRVTVAELRSLRGVGAARPTVIEDRAVAPGI